jgi:spoIIIJ-associated protein
MADHPTTIEMDVPADQVDAAVASVCTEWGVERAAVVVDLQARNGERVHLTITHHGAEETDFGDEADEDSGPIDPQLELARQTLADLLEKMTIAAEVVAEWTAPDPATGERAMVLDVRGDDLGLLIGRKGETLAALQYITRLILSKATGEGVDVIVDVQGHKRRREEQLRRMARRMAEQAAQRHRVMTLEPMPANERRIVHLELRDHPSVRTESVGEGTHRKVTIIPK